MPTFNKLGLADAYRFPAFPLLAVVHFTHRGPAAVVINDDITAIRSQQLTCILPHVHLSLEFMLPPFQRCFTY